MKLNSYILLEFKGRLNGPLLDQLLASLQWNLEETETSVSLRKRVFSIAMESFQNVYRYAPQLTHSLSGEVNDDMAYSEAHLTVVYEQGKYKVKAGNMLLKEQENALTKQLEEVNHADSESLRQRYNETLQNYRTSNNKGAGLGLMDMKRKANSPLIYTIQPYQDHFWFDIELQIW